MPSSLTSATVAALCAAASSWVLGNSAASGAGVGALRHADKRWGRTIAPEASAKNASGAGTGGILLGDGLSAQLGLLELAEAPARAAGCDFMEKVTMTDKCEKDKKTNCEWRVKVDLCKKCDNSLGDPYCGECDLARAAVVLGGCSSGGDAPAEFLGKCEGDCKAKVCDVVGKCGAGSENAYENAMTKKASCCR